MAVVEIPFDLALHVFFKITCEQRNVNYVFFKFIVFGDL